MNFSPLSVRFKTLFLWFWLFFIWNILYIDVNISLEQKLNWKSEMKLKERCKTSNRMLKNKHGFLYEDSWSTTLLRKIPKISNLRKFESETKPISVCFNKFCIFIQFWLVIVSRATNINQNQIQQQFELSLFELNPIR
jgi:hypothetical protein